MQGAEHFRLVPSRRFVEGSGKTRKVWYRPPEEVAQAYKGVELRLHCGILQLCNRDSRAFRLSKRAGMNNVAQIVNLLTMNLHFFTLSVTPAS